MKSIYKVSLRFCDLTQAVLTVLGLQQQNRNIYVRKGGIIHDF